MAGKKWDAVVIGAGPAGASAARTLVEGGLKCLLIEKKKMPREKMCSGILSNWVVDFVHRKFGVIPAHAYASPNFLDGVALHFPSIEEPVTIDSYTAIPNIWRSHFDHFLAETSRATIRDGYTLQNIEPHSDGYMVTCKFSRGGRTANESFRTKYIVAADGPNSCSLRLVMPEVIAGLPFGVGMQMHYRGEINIDPRRYHVFFHRGMGFYAWASIKGEDIHVGSGIMGIHGQRECLDNFITLLKKRYSLKIQKTIRAEGMAGALKGPLNKFTIGKGNFLAAGDAGGFVHNFGEGISCALTTGDLAGQAIIKAAETGDEAYSIYREIVRPEAELCLDQFNPLRMLKKTPMPMDFKSFRKRYSPGQMFSMYRDLNKYKKQDNSYSASGISSITRKNMIYHMFRGKYPLEL